MSDRNKSEGEPESSWLDELSLSTKIVFVITFGSIAILAVLFLIDLFF